jgi:2-oxoglutarate ferredoxin oxidoreductase subunit alpha
MSERSLLTGSHFMNGDHACAEGAIAAGCRFFGGYPITPSTEIAERLARRLPEVGGVFIQMEDEMASMATILGAAAAGKRSMTATSGPGFSLMMENIGLGIMMELPCVVVNVQRGSPSTGLPTLPGQSDIMQAKWGSHGDYEAVAYSPWSPQEFFDLTIRAFNVADQLRTPVFIMADEVVGHMVERVEIPEADQIEIVGRRLPENNGNGSRPFAADEEDLVPPMTHAGEGYRVHFTGLTHDERGYPDMSAEAHHQLVKRLNDKIILHRAQIMQYEAQFIDDARVIVLSFGCTARSARRAVRTAREKGHPVGFIRLISLWPFPGEVIQEIASGVDHFIVAEMNLGQVSRELERYVHQPVTGVHHSGGAMMPPEIVLDAINQVMRNG